MREVWASKDERRRPEDFRPDMPPVDPAAEFLISYLYEIGPVLGDGPITQQELRAWQENTGIELTSWQARTLCRLSQEYMAESRKAEKRDAKPVWQPEGAKPLPTAAQVALRAAAQG